MSIECLNIIMCHIYHYFLSIPSLLSLIPREYFAPARLGCWDDFLVSTKYSAGLSTGAKYFTMFHFWKSSFGVLSGAVMESQRYFRVWPAVVVGSGFASGVCLWSWSVGHLPTGVSVCQREIKPMEREQTLPASFERLETIAGVFFSEKAY